MGLVLLCEAIRGEFVNTLSLLVRRCSMLLWVTVVWPSTSWDDCDTRPLTTVFVPHVPEPLLSSPLSLWSTTAGVVA